MATEDQLKKLRTYRRVLGSHAGIVANKAANKHAVVTDADAAPIIGELARLERDFPGLAPQFDLVREVDTLREGFYHIAGFQAHLASVLGRLETELESTNEASPVIEKREFSFVRDVKLRAILERDYSEIQTAYVAHCWKSVIILSGGALETVLLDVVRRNEAAAKASPKAPKQADITKWDLSDLIDVCVDRKLVNEFAAAASHATRAYRNLVHPGNEIRTGLIFAEEEARIALTILQAIHRDLSR